jgi:hypothetical protein
MDSALVAVYRSAGMVTNPNEIAADCNLRGIACKSRAVMVREQSGEGLHTYPNYVSCGQSSDDVAVALVVAGSLR